MPIESWTVPDETPDLAARASAMIDAALVGTDLARDAYWAAVRKGYNTPYNDPPRRRAGSRPDAGPAAGPEAPPPSPPLPIAAMALLTAEARAA